MRVWPRSFVTSRKPPKSRIWFRPSSSLAGKPPSISPGPLANRGVPILGSQPDSIDLAEDRHRFEGFLRALAIPQPPGAAVTTLGDARSVAGRIGYPVLVRPSYVLGGRAMEVVYSQEQLAATSRTRPAHARTSGAHRQIPHGSGSRSRRHLRRRAGPHPWDHGAHRAGREFTPVIPSRSTRQSTYFRRKSRRLSTTRPGSD